MELLMNRYSWEIFCIPIAVIIIAQCIKIALYSKKGHIAWDQFNKYGGMPSAHTGMFVSLTLVVFLTQGLHSPLTFVTGFISAVFIRDAVGIRWALGYHAKMLNKLIADLPEDERAEYPKHLEERLGHTPKEALAGGTVAVVVTLLLHSLTSII